MGWNLVSFGTQISQFGPEKTPSCYTYPSVPLNPFHLWLPFLSICVLGPALSSSYPELPYTDMWNVISVCG